MCCVTFIRPLVSFAHLPTHLFSCSSLIFCLCFFRHRCTIIISSAGLVNSRLFEQTNTGFSSCSRSSHSRRSLYWLPYLFDKTPLDGTEHLLLLSGCRALCTGSLSHIILPLIRFVFFLLLIGGSLTTVCTCIVCCGCAVSLLPCRPTFLRATPLFPSIGSIKFLLETLTVLFSSCLPLFSFYDGEARMKAAVCPSSVPKEWSGYTRKRHSSLSVCLHLNSPPIPRARSSSSFRVQPLTIFT